MPPTSAWCARDTAKPASVRETSVMSGRWVPPVNGSLTAKTSPGAGSRAITAATASGIAPRCTGMCSAWAIIRPPASKSAVEQSRRSLMFDENAERISAAPISSAAATSALPITCSSTFTRLALAALAAAAARRQPDGDGRAPGRERLGAAGVTACRERRPSAPGLHTAAAGSRA